MPSAWEPPQDQSDAEDGPLAEINIIPLVDVMLVLLIIFMITVPMMKAGVDVSLPRGEHAAPMEEKRIVIALTRDKEVFIEEEPVHEAVLTERLEAAAAAGTAVYLYADRTLPYGDVMEFMDRLKGAGVETVALVMEERPLK